MCVWTFDTLSVLVIKIIMYRLNTKHVLFAGLITSSSVLEYFFLQCTGTVVKTIVKFCHMIPEASYLTGNFKMLELKPKLLGY